MAGVHRKTGVIFLLCACAVTAALSDCGGSGSAPPAASPSGSTPPPQPSVHTDVSTYRDNPGRTGANLTETVLTPANVNSSSFGLLRLLSVDGKVDAQPLYLAQVAIAGATRNVVFVATENDSVYAFDAQSGATLWHVSLLGSGESPSDDRGCGQITPEIGVTSTPVIDRAAGPHGAIFVVAMSKDSSSNYHQRLHALDITTGSELFNGPVMVNPTYSTAAGGEKTFAPGQYAERAALLLENHTIYTSWTSHCDVQPYSGWIVAYSESTLAQTAVLNVAADSDAGPSVWMSGGGPAADSSGNIYLITANGGFETTLNSNGLPQYGDYGNSFLKLSTAGGGLAVADYFSPSNEIAESAADEDLGSGGTLKAFTVADAKLANVPSSQTNTQFPYPGTTPAVSANGTSNGIVWAVENSNPAVLYAYDATDLTHELYNSTQAAGGRDNFGAGNKFIAPTIADGMVFVGTPDGVAVFGLL